jgi:hypothetical protein
MARIQLNRSGGFLGKKLQASIDVDLNGEELDSIKNARAEINPESRDDFHYSIAIDNNAPLPVDVSLLTGRIKEVVEDLESKLKSE